MNWLGWARVWEIHASGSVGNTCFREYGKYMLQGDWPECAQTLEDPVLWERERDRGRETGLRYHHESWQAPQAQAGEAWGDSQMRTPPPPQQRSQWQWIGRSPRTGYFGRFSSPLMADRQEVLESAPGLWQCFVKCLGTAWRNMGYALFTIKRSHHWFNNHPQNILMNWLIST